MNVLRGVMITVGVISVLIIVVAMQGQLGGSWETVGQSVAPLAIALAVFGIAASFLASYMRR